MNNIYVYVVLAILAFVAFIVLLRRGSFLRISDYCRETQEELKKCTWPSLEELKGSTIVVIISIVVLGAFTMGVDAFVTLLVRNIV